VSLWKRRLLEKAIEEPYKEIGQLKVEEDFLSRRLGML